MKNSDMINSTQWSPGCQTPGAPMPVKEHTQREERLRLPPAVRATAEAGSFKWRRTRKVSLDHHVWPKEKGVYLEKMSTIRGLVINWKTQEIVALTKASNSPKQIANTCIADS
jgi:hypothetical protein